MKKPLIIFDTDMDTDCDDAGALALLLNAHKEGRCTLLGIVGDAPVSAVAPCCEALCDAYGVRLQIGAVYEHPLIDTPRFADYKFHYGELEGKHYNATVSAYLGKRDTDYPSAKTVYRRLLADAEQNSVTIVCVGLMTAFADLLNSEADAVSPLDGVSLVRQKVKRVISMGNAAYPEMKKHNFNYKMDRQGAQTVFERCPVSIHLCPFGTDIITGHTLSSRLPAEHPLRRAYEIYNGKGRGRSSWDLVCVYYALNPDSTYFTAETNGSVRYDEQAHRTYWVENGERTDYHLSSAITDRAWMELLEEMLY